MALDQTQRQALQSLLAEDEPKLKRLVIERLCARPTEKCQPIMRELAASADSRVKKNALQILAHWGCDASRLELFLQAIRENALQTWEDLEQFSWDLSAFEHGLIEQPTHRVALNKLAERGANPDSHGRRSAAKG